MLPYPPESPVAQTSRKRQRDSSSSYDYHYEKNIEALEAARVEHDRILRNAKRTQRILEVEEVKAWQLEALQAAEEERRIAEHRVEIARLDAQRDQAKLDAQEKADELQRIVAEEEAQGRNKKRRQSLEAKEAEAARRSGQEAQSATAAASAVQEPTPSQAPERLRSTPQPLAPPPQTNQINGTPSSTTASPAPDVEARHQRYLKIHVRLKQVRKDAFKAFKQDAGLVKELQQTFGGMKLGNIGDLRREMRKRVVQLTVDIKSNLPSVQAIKLILSKALTVRSLCQDPTHFMVDSPNLQNKNIGVSTLFIALLSTFSKSIINKFISEATESLRSSEPVGIAALTIFSNNDLRYEGQSFIDILLAKYNKACPLLFGIFGSERTDAGRRRLGWRKDEESGKWITDQAHFERMTGLGAGFGSLSLRDFSRAVNLDNPFPAHNYWIALARLLNATPEQITRTQCVVIKAMVEVHVEKFVGFYGAAAIGVLRTAVGAFPQKAEESTESVTLAALQGGIRKRYHLTL